jgi:hypothetical protein
MSYKVVYVKAKFKPVGRYETTDTLTLLTSPFWQTGK